LNIYTIEYLIHAYSPGPSLQFLLSLKTKFLQVKDWTVCSDTTLNFIESTFMTQHFFY
jgi:hypothetical protein